MKDTVVAPPQPLATVPPPDGKPMTETTTPHSDTTEPWLPTTPSPATETRDPTEVMPQVPQTNLPQLIASTSLRDVDIKTAVEPAPRPLNATPSGPAITALQGE